MEPFDSFDEFDEVPAQKAFKKSIELVQENVGGNPFPTLVEFLTYEAEQAEADLKDIAPLEPDTEVQQPKKRGRKPKAAK